MALMLDEEMDENVTTIKVIGVGGGKGQRNAAPQLGWGRDGDSLAAFGAGKAECKKSQQKQQQERETSFQDHHLSLYFTQQVDKKDQAV